jgi:tetrapyrrole methylase family protein/MazG family protein
MAITIVGLGSGPASHMTRQAWDLLISGEKIYLRTKHHPVLGDLPPHVSVESFDHLYDSEEDFEQLYKKIAASILSLGRSEDGVIYAVPGHPLVGEATVTLIMERARLQGIEVMIVPGVSFVEPVLAALGYDALDGLQLFDAMQIARYLQPPLNTDVPLLLGQVYSRFVAGELKIALMALYPEDHEVVLIHEAGTDRQVLEIVPLYKIDRSDRLAHLSSLYIPKVANASSLQSFAETVAYLRSPAGCPWDQEQTRASLRADFLEESAEVMDALDIDDPEALQEELGDLLHHLVMQAQIASEQEEFHLSDIISGIEAKLRKRHPHVWGDQEVSTSAEVVHTWEKLKQEEAISAGKSESLIANIPSALPALARAQKIQSVVRAVGFDWSSLDGVIEKVDEELSELHEADGQVNWSKELGDVLFALVNWARWRGANAEVVLREANRRFERRFREMEEIAERRNQRLSDLSLSDLDSLWDEAKLSLES